MGYYEGNISDLGCNNNNGAFGNNGDWIWAFLLFALLGNGVWGGRGGYGNVYAPFPATQADLANGFAQNTLQRGIDDIILGQSNMQNFINQGFSGVNATVTNGFANLNTALCSLGYNIQGGFNDLSHHISDCCCTTQRAIDSVNFNMAKNTCDIIRAGQDNTNAIIGWLTQEKIASLQAENSGLKAQISNDRQTTNIVNELRNGNCPVPAYLACDPRVPFNYGQYFNNSGCGCGCGCN